MPVYDFRCEKCEKVFSVQMSYQDYGRKAVACPACGAKETRRIFGRVAEAQDDRERLAEYSKSGMLNRADDDPKALGKMMEDMKKMSGAQMRPEFDEVVGRLKRGDSIDSIDRDYQDYE